MNNIILMNKNYEYVHVITLCGFPLRIQLTGQFVSAEQSVDGHISASPGIWPMADCYIVLCVLTLVTSQRWGCVVGGKAL